MMAQAYIVTEGQSDADILKTVLPKHLVEKVHFVVGEGRSSALSLAVSLLSNGKYPLALIIDTDTHHPDKIQEQIDLREAILRRSGRPEAYRIFSAVPEIEVVFFQDKELVEKVTQHLIGQDEWQFARRDPRFFLQEHVTNYPDALPKLLAQLPEGQLATVREHPLLRDLLSFITASANGNGHHRRESH